MSGLQQLVSSAFGSNACLYKDVLNCSSEATPSDLRKNYHKLALQYHPDKQQESSSKEATLKFQALSATYQLLSDPSQRALYDSTGRIPGSEDEHNADTSEASAGRRTPHTSKKNTDKWIRFFQSVFQDMINAGSNFDRKEYCGSKKEEEDVLKYYQLCKGDRSKMMSCIVQSEQEDSERWWNDIIQPAIKKGNIANYEPGANASADETKKKRPKKLVRKRKRSEAQASKQRVDDLSIGNDLEDTDDENDKESCMNIRKPSKVMSRKEKMEFRVAKKRKEKQEREIEIAGIMQSKQWTANSFAKAADGKRKRRNQHGLSESFLSGLQEKFSANAKHGKKKKLKRK